MFDFILHAITGSNPAVGLIAGLFWPLVSIPDLIKISALLVGAAILQLWVRKFRNRDCCGRHE
jgi:hypothetical protein